MIIIVIIIIIVMIIVRIIMIINPDLAPDHFHHNWSWQIDNVDDSIVKGRIHYENAKQYFD